MPDLVVVQGGSVMASVSGSDPEWVWNEALRYAALYSEEGPVTVLTDQRARELLPDYRTMVEEIEAEVAADLAEEESDDA